MQQSYRHGLQDLFDDVSGVSLAVITSLHDPVRKHEVKTSHDTNNMTPVYEYLQPGGTQRHNPVMNEY